MKYNIILCDAPWKYKNFTAKKNGAAAAHYPGLTIKELCNLPVGDIAQDNSVLFFWITNPFLAEGKHLQIFEAWGFIPVSVAFSWLKTNKDGSPYFGVGFNTRNDTEICLLGKKGKGLQRQSKSVRQSIVSPRTKHSAKPPEVRNRIVELFGDLPRIELFARPPIPSGWDATGLEYDGKDINDSLQEIINK